jgi:predicted aldo/keto reductase-like oxidoreductase
MPPLFMTASAGDFGFGQKETHSMKYGALGRSGDKVSILGLGCMRLPVIDGNEGRIDETQASRLLHLAAEPASSCTRCEALCPQHIPIMDLQAESHRRLSEKIED